ncbi:MAG: hypothetical protein CMH55_06480 [Myxococcales bacterium]|nr:hypothetical protein [Myxococcales bacterium]
MPTRLCLLAALSLLASPALAQDSRFKESTPTASPATSPVQASPARKRNRRRSARRGKFKGYFQLGSLPFELSGFQNAHLSDHQKHGLKSLDDSNPEGRIDLPLEQYNVPAGLLPAARIGIAGSGPVAWSGELAFSGANSFTALVATLGVDINRKVGPLSIGVPLRVGFVGGSANLGKITVLDGYNAPVELDNPERVFSEGDDLSAGVSGGLASAGLSAEFWVTPNLGLRADVSFQQGFFGDAISVTATEPLPEGTEEGETATRKKTTVSGDDAAIVKPDGSGVPVDMKIVGGSWGAAAYVGVTWRPRL